MMVAPHLRELQVFNRVGGVVHLLFDGEPMPHPTPARGHLLFLGDDPGPPIGSKGPDAFDCPDLRSWIERLDDGCGCVGIFGGAPMPRAYGSLCAGALHLPAGGVIIECADRHWLSWSRYVFLHAPRACRFDVIPEAHIAEAQAQIIAEGGFLLSAA
jgi:hypothetical protein